MREARPPGHSAHALPPTRSIKASEGVPRHAQDAPAGERDPRWLLRQISRWRRDGIIVGSIRSLALERAYIYQEHAGELRSATFPTTRRRARIEARFSMLEKLADHDDALMEQLLEEIEPPRDAVFDDLARPICGKGSSRRCSSVRPEKGNGRPAPYIEGDPP